MDKTVLKGLLVDLLSARSPELGARLKSRLIAKCLGSGLGPFDEKALGWPKFGDFLEDFGDVLVVERSLGASDIQVSLKRNVEAPTERREARESEHEKIRSAVWQAFLNPDPRRKRFIGRASGEVVHFRDDEDSRGVRVRAAPSDFAEIKPIAAEQQRDWMLSYLADLDLPSGEKAAIEPLAKANYSSQLNAAFTRALGDRASTWKVFRLRKISELVDEWVSQNALDRRHVYESSPTTPQDRCSIATPGMLNGGVRRRAIELLDLVTDDDIHRLVIPILMAAIVVRAKP